MNKEYGESSVRGRGNLAARTLTIILAVGWPMPAQVNETDLRRDFAEPPLRYQSRPLWFWNGPLSVERTRAMLEACKQRGYYGVGILPAHGMSPAFMTPEFLDQYQMAVDTAASLGMRLCLYDEYWFPSGSAGGLLAKRHPEALSQRLDMATSEVTGPKEIIQPVPAGTFMGAVAMNLATKNRLNISDRVKDGKLTCEVPDGDWRIMLFTCVRDGAGGLVDYLSPDAVRRFVSLTYEAYYGKFPAHFGATIDSAFYDEPTFHWVQGGRAWTEKFNEKFRQVRGYDPVIDYPALWFDIGPETAAARNALFGFRAELYSTGFPKTLNDWCREHRIQLTGHVDQEEIVNPVGLCGDLIKAFKHQDIPAIDQIFQYGRASKAYKIVSSAACNYDRPRVLTECYGGINDMPPANLYKEAMDQFAKGINVMVPHAVWYAPANVIFQPDLSPTNATYGPHLSEYNRYIGRLQRMLQGGRHVADIGVLYPIATLQGGYYFGPGKPYEGGVIPPEADYMEIGEMLALQVRRDYTFIHPETLAERCTVAGSRIRLNNATNHEEYRVFIVPGSRTIHTGTLEKLEQFYRHGGQIIATTQLPEHAAEFGQDTRVRESTAAIFGTHPVPGAGGFSIHTNPTGGRAWFVPSPTAGTLKAILDVALPLYDVQFEQDIQVTGGNLSYIHKVMENRDVYFFANSSDREVAGSVLLRGRLKLEQWDPHSGRVGKVESSHGAKGGEAFTGVRLRLPPVQSRFLVSAARPR